MSEVEKLGFIEGLPLRLDEERGMALWLDPEYAPNQPNVAITRDLLRRLCRAIQASDVEAEEAHKLGKSDGYEEAVADIDRLTGGDGEYVFSTLPGEGCPNPEAMKARIVERFEAASTLQSQSRRVEELEGALRMLRSVVSAPAWDGSRTIIIGSIDLERVDSALSAPPRSGGLGSSCTNLDGSPSGATESACQSDEGGGL